MHILPKGRDGAQIDIMSAPMEEGNAIAYTMNMVATNNRIGILPTFWTTPVVMFTLRFGIVEALHTHHSCQI